MPLYLCKHPTCSTVQSVPGYCAVHLPLAPVRAPFKRSEASEDAQRFYRTAGWKRARIQKLTANPWCENCKRKFATDVHHKVKAAESIALRLDQGNLVSLCHECHSYLTARGF